MKINARLNIKNLKREFPRAQNKIKRAAYRAINKSMITVKNKKAPDISEKMGGAVKPAQIKKEFVIKKAKFKYLRGEMHISGGPLPLLRFSARQTQKGVSYKIGTNRKILKHGFIATMPNGHKGVFLRRGDRRKGIKRRTTKGLHVGKWITPELRIVEKKGPSIPITVKDLEKEMYTLGLKEWQKNFNREIKYYLGVNWK